MTEQRVAVVTGGASGMGRATSDLLEARGVGVAVLDLKGGIHADVSDARSIDEALVRVRETLGPVSILVNAAGVAAGGPIDGPGYLDEWERSVAINLTGTTLMVRACIGDLIASGAGRIVNIASTDALGAGRHAGPYVVAKHGV